ncbi:MAG TPA: MBL fold metallo-hydrolase, partial [Chloroflexota bacterium]|nr:MBL fold metallo-hydrolase [Chloroflexota bacterium]
MADDRPRTSTVSVILGTDERPQLIRWTTWWDSPGSWDSYALMTPDGPVLVDPEGLTSDGERRLLELTKGATPRASVLTNDMHERGAYDAREKWGAPVWGPAYGTPERGGRMDEGTPDHLYDDGDTLPGGMRAHKLEGGAFAGDTVLIWTSPEGKRVLFTGDALNGPFHGANPAGPHPRRGQPGLYLGAGPFYLDRATAPRLKESFTKLLSEKIDLICGSHGDPFTVDPNGALARLLEVEWEPMFKERVHP